MRASLNKVGKQVAYLHSYILHKGVNQGYIVTCSSLQIKPQSAAVIISALSVTRMLFYDV
jgi:hypothetical protein